MILSQPRNRSMSAIATSVLTFTLIGGPTVLVEYHGLRFVTDPTFDASGSVYPRGHVTLRKTSSPACPPDDLGRIDAVLLSHDQHADNLDEAGRALLARVPLTLTTPAAASRLGGTVRGLAPWESVTLTSPDATRVRITATPARHGPAGIERLAGDVTGFIVEAENTPTVYVTGDTVYYEGVAEVAQRFAPEVILAFAGAARPRGPMDLTMSANDLLDTAQAFPHALILPVHSEGWEHFTLPAETARQMFENLGQGSRIELLTKGRPLTYPKLPEPAVSGAR
jgi:L-ascorbate metabolism protein UlaG (beta-lactamase superfamily)